MASKALRVRADRRVHSKSIERRQRILDAAARALAEQGYSEAKLSDIAEEAGTHAGSLYYYFPSREHLMKEVLLTSLNRMSDFQGSLKGENAHLSPLEAILAFVRVVIDQTQAPDDYYLRAFLRNGNQVPDSMRKVLQTRRQQMRRTMVRLIKEAQAAGQISDRLQPTVTAQFIIGATSWTGMWYRADGPVPVEVLTETFVGLVLRGLLGQHGPSLSVVPQKPVKAVKTAKPAKVVGKRRPAPRG